MLKLTTDKHEASSGLSATAELLVIRIRACVFVCLYAFVFVCDFLSSFMAATQQ